MISAVNSVLIVNSQAILKNVWHCYMQVKKIQGNTPKKQPATSYG